jgi:hypothetical protein
VRQQLPAQIDVSDLPQAKLVHSPTPVAHSNSTKKGTKPGRHTKIILRNPRHRIQIIPSDAIIVNPNLAIIVDVRDDAVHLQGRLDEPCEPEDEEDECADEDYARQEEALHRENDDEDDEEKGERACCKRVGEEPI